MKSFKESGYSFPNYILVGDDKDPALSE